MSEPSPIEPRVREALGRTVRDIWIEWAREQPDIDSHPNWLMAWEQLGERDREVDRLIGERLFAAGWAARASKELST